MGRIRIFLYGVLLSITGVSGSIAADFPGRAGLVNIARGCSYRWNVQPEYSLCADAGDDVQLTDGQLTSGSSPIWDRKSTVGWDNSRSVTIIIDLGSDRPISGFALSMAAGASDVKFPSNIFVMTSSNGSDYYLKGDLVQMTNHPLPPSNSYSGFTYQTTDVKTHGRFVFFNFIIPGPGNYIFIDEIEVYEGESDFLKLPDGGSAIAIRDGDLSGYFTTIGCRARFERDIRQIRSRLHASAICTDLKKSVSDSLDKYEKQIRDFVINEISGFRAIVPFNHLHENILACHGQILKGEGIPVLSVWHRFRYAPISPLETPEQENPSLSLRMMQNEYRSEVFNLTNADQKPLEVKFCLKGLPGWVEVRELGYVDTREGIVTAAPLIPVHHLSGSYQVTIPSGMTRQIWLTFWSADTDAGNYAGSIEIEAAGIQKSVPLELTVSSLSFPEKTSLNVGVWDYAAANRYGVNGHNRQKVMDDLRSHFVNVAVGTRAQAAVPNASAIDTCGHITKPLNFSSFDKWLQLWPNARHYKIYYAVTLSDNNFSGVTRGTPAFRQAVKEWAAAWDHHVRELNLSKGQVQMYFMDEPRTPEAFRILREWVEAFREGSDLVDLFCDPTNLHLNNTMKDAPAALTQCNVICPLTSQLLVYPPEIRDFFDACMKNGEELWLYMCSPNKHVDPAYFRMQPWYAFDLSATGSCFWNYSDSRGNPWNEYVVHSGVFRNSFSMVYLDDDGPVSTRHWEAMREGIEDYEYLSMLREKSKDPDRAKAVAKEALKKLEAVTGQNLTMKWSTENPSYVADEGRIEVLQAIEQLCCMPGQTGTVPLFNEAGSVPAQMNSEAVPVSNFTSDTGTARKFGVHEVVLRGSRLKANPFDTDCQVVFVAPSGRRRRINAFYDGGKTWRARVYVDEEGAWTWESFCDEDSRLGGIKGNFRAIDSDLRGMLHKAPGNPKQWKTDNGQWFLNISDTGYHLFNKNETLWKAYIEDLSKLGVTSVRAGSLGGVAWDEESPINQSFRDAYPDCNAFTTDNNPWMEENLYKINLERFRTSDERMIWMLNNYPDIYIQLILFGIRTWGKDDTGEQWNAIPQEVRNSTMKYMVARWSAFPQIFYLIVNDLHCSDKFPDNQSFIREVGRYFAANDPWEHLISAGPNRFQKFPFTDEEDLEWVSYIHIEDLFALDAREAELYETCPLHVFLGEDWYEHTRLDRSRDYLYHPEYFYRWLFWSWTLSGGSANYGGRWARIHPYFSTGSLLYTEPLGGLEKESRNTQTSRNEAPASKTFVRAKYNTQLKGLNSVKYITDFFSDRRIDLSEFIPDPGMVSDKNTREEGKYLKLMRKGDKEFIIYDPNALSGGNNTLIDIDKTVRFCLDFGDINKKYSVNWYCPLNGNTVNGGQIECNGRVSFEAPWQGVDVILYLKEDVDRAAEVIK
ncbi:MAG: DUF5060 domain-containing protein [Prolixibacteraceae bacterium]